jgi:hypothetical protein
MFHVPIEGECELELSLEYNGRDFEEAKTGSIVPYISSAPCLARLSSHAVQGLKQRIGSLKLSASQLLAKFEKGAS